MGQQVLPLLDREAFAIEGKTGLVEPHLQALTEADERIACQALTALDALEQEPRLEGTQLQIRGYGCIQVGGNVKRRLHRLLFFSPRISGEPSGSGQQKTHPGGGSEMGLL